MIEHLPRVIAAAPDRPQVGGPDHPMRKVTRQVAFEPTGWTPERAAKITDLFNGLAPEWHTRFGEGRQLPLEDALDRGDVHGELCIEVGSGIGGSTPLLTPRFTTVVAADIAIEMLRRAPADHGHRMLADAATLPLPDRSADVMVLENALLFPHEVDRVLAPRGVLIWVNSLGDATPIHLPAEDVASALPGKWTGSASEAGWGTWCVLRRA